MFELTPWKRSTEVMRPFRELDEVFNRFLADFPLWNRDVERTGTWMPSLDVTETDKEVLVKVEAPGMETKDIDISLAGDLLTIKGEKHEEKQDHDACCHLVERRYGSFSRTLRLPVEVAQDNIDAAYKNGILTITLPKTEQARERVRKIEIH